MKRLFERLHTDDEGLTLIELLISMGLLTIIIGPITFGFILTLLETSAAHERVADSSGAQVISAFLLSDIQSSQEVRLTGDPLDSCTPAGNVLLELEWQEPASRAPVVVSYVSKVNAANAAQNQLFRVECAANGTLAPTLLALNLQSASGSDPFDVKCDGSDVCSDPETVSVTIEANSVDPAAESSYDAFKFNVEARRRVGST